jgi:hypothetical protein
VWRGCVVCTNDCVGIVSKTFPNGIYCTVFGHSWTPICNLLGYRRHHSICYTYLFTTLLVVTTISVYNELWPSNVVSRSGPLISSLFCLLSVCSWMLTTNSNFWLSKSTVLSRSSGLQREHLVQGFSLSSTQLWLAYSVAAGTQQFGLYCLGSFLGSGMHMSLLPLKYAFW